MAHGIHFFMNPGPTNIPERILRAMDRGAIDFTGAQFKAIAEECFAGAEARLQDRGDDPRLCRDRARRVGGGAGQSVLAGRQGAGGRERLFLAELGHARRGLRARGRDPGQRLAPRRSTRRELETRLREDREHQIKAVLVVHCETSTGVINPIAALAPRDRRGASTRRCFWSTRSRRWPRWISASTNGASTSSSPARRRA